MKNIHGKIFLLFLILFTNLYAQENKFCSYNLESSKYKDIVVNEPIRISFFTRQKTHSEVMFFDLIAQKSDSYEIISIKEKRYEYNYHDAQKEFEFLLIPKISGKMKVDFTFNIRRASDDAVAIAYVGSRDNVKSIPTVKMHIASPSLTIDVKKSAQEVDAIGSFSFSMKLEKSNSNSYDAINVVYSLEGKGVLNENYEPISSIKNISIFKGIKETTPRPTTAGYIYKKEWSYALIAPKSFTLPAVKLKTYNYKREKFVTRETQSKEIIITPLDIKNLLDERDLPKSNIDFKEYLHYFYNVLLFISGFIVAKLLNYIPKKVSKQQECCKIVENASTAKELLRASLSFGAHNVNLKSEIMELEEIVYQNKSSKKIAAIKTAIIQKIRSA